MNVDINEFLNICMNCIIKCQQCALYSLGRFGMESCSKIADECSRLCSLTSYLMTHSRDNHSKILEICNDMCNMCSEECDKFNYEFAQECSRACLKMAIFCRQLLADEKKIMMSA